MTFGGVAWGCGAWAGDTSAASAAIDEPFVHLEIAFTTDPGSTSPAWVDISYVNGLPRVRSGQTRRGRNKELDAYQAGTASFVVSNADRLLDPNYASGPFYGYVKPMRRIRARATHNGVTYPLFDGFIDSIDQAYTNPGDATLVISAIDGFIVLNAARLPTSVYALTVRNDAPVSWWHCGDPQTGGRLRDYVGTTDLTSVLGAPTWAASSLAVRETNGAINFPATTAGVESINVPFPVTGGPLTIEFLLNTTGSSPAVVFAFVTGATGVGAACSLSSGQLRFAVSLAAGTFTDQYTTATITDGVTRHYACVWQADGALKIYSNGVDVSSLASAITPAAFSPAIGIVAAGACHAPDLTPGAVGTLDEVAVYNYALTAAQALAHYQAATTPWVGDTMGTRIGRELDGISWPSNLRELDTGQSVLQASSLDDSAFNLIQIATQSEFGEFYMTRDGTARAEQRTSLINQPSFATFGDAAGEIGYVDIKPNYTAQLIRNDVIISRENGAAQETKDAASISTNLLHAFTRDGLQHNDDQLSKDAATFYVSEYKDALQRFSQITIKPMGDPANMFPQTLGRELTDHVTINRRPQGVGSVVSQASVIEGISHSFSPRNWTTTFDVSPAYAGSFLQWDVGTWDNSRWYF